MVRFATSLRAVRPTGSALRPRLLRASAATAPLALLLIAPAMHAQTNPFGLSNAGSSVVPTFGDLDSDGDADLLACQGGTYAYYANTGTATAPAFAAPQAAPFGLPTCDPSGLDLADLDGDGDLDIVSGTAGGTFVYIPNTGTATAPAFGTPQPNPFGLGDIGDSSSPTLADFDGDGDLDLLSGSKIDQLYYYENTGTATAPVFGAAVVNPFGIVRPSTGFEYSHPTSGDYDGDGDIDVLVGSVNGTISFYRNTGTTTAPAFAAPESPPAGVTAQATNSNVAPAFVNLDGGTPDVFIGLNSGDFVFFANPTLPVELVAFSAAVDGDVAVLRWETASETGNAGFAVERLTSDGVFADGAEHLGFVPGHGTTSEAHRYTFRTERLSVGAHRFRLRQIDTDGTATLSPTVEVRVAATTAFALTDASPSPTRGTSRVSLSLARTQSVTVAVYDALGRRMATLHEGVLTADAAHAFEIDARGWPSGTYHIVATGEGVRTDRRLVVVR